MEREVGTYATERATAYHEAGHAIVALHRGVFVSEVTIVRDILCLGRCSHGNADDQTLIEICLAGEVAAQRSRLQQEFREFKPGTKFFYRAQPDIDEIVTDQPICIRRCFMGNGCELGHCSDATIAMNIASHWPLDTRMLLENCLRQTKSILTRRWSAVEKLAMTLMFGKTLTGEQATAIFRAAL